MLESWHLMPPLPLLDDDASDLGLGFSASSESGSPTGARARQFRRSKTTMSSLVGEAKAKES